MKLLYLIQRIAGWIVSAILIIPHLPCLGFIFLAERPWKRQGKPDQAKIDFHRARFAKLHIEDQL